MITNERQYRITRAQVNKFKEAIESFDIKKITKRMNSVKLAKAELAALQSEFDSLSVQIKEYETLKSGSLEKLKATSLGELPGILIRARIAQGFSQSKLAKLIGVKEQQIQRYEAEEYASANLSRLGEVAKALELSISEIAEFNKIPKPINAGEHNMRWEEFPVKEMYRLNWFADYFSGSLSAAVENAEELVKEFITGVLDQPIRSAARQRVRSSGVVNMHALLVWQCRVIYLAKKEKLQNKFKQKNITYKWLRDLAKLSSQSDSPQKAILYLKEYGIRLEIVPRLHHTHLDGAALLLSDGPVIGMTLRHDRLDNFWFVLFHELIHIKKHLHKGTVETIFDDLEAEANDIEKEADKDAGEILVPANKWETALARYLRSERTIISLAEELNISSAIVAGKIRREAENYSLLTDMVGQGEVRKLFPNVYFSY